MKRKNKLFNFLLILFSILVFQSSFAQTFQYSSPNFNITVPSLSDLNPNQINPRPYYTFFIETGNGRYKKVTEHVYGAYSNPPYPVLYTEAIPPGSTGLLNIIGHYDTIKPPRGLLSASGISNSVLTLAPQTNLSSNKKIGFDVSDSTVVIGDTMTLVITYKPDSVNNNVIAFFYNDNSTPGGKVFYEFSDPDQPFPFADGTRNRVVMEKAIRTRDETATISATAFPSAVSAALTASQGNYINVIYFIPTNVTNSNERNIFISMVTPMKASLSGSVANLKAVIVKYNNANNIVSPEPPAILSLPVGMFASDPNGITTTPHCLSDLPGGPFNKPINYEIDFRNVGTGNAKHIEATVIIPEGIQFPPKNKYETLRDLKCMVGREIKTIRKKQPQDLNSLNDIKKQSFTYEYITSGGQRKILFQLKNINLPGTAKEPKDILKREGKINFTLNTIPKDPQNPNAPFPPCMYSDVEIVFISAIGNEEIRGSVIKGDDLIRNNCHPVIPLPPCSRPTNLSYVPPKTQ